MKKRIYSLFACIPMMLSACAEKPQESKPQPETIATAEPATATVEVTETGNTESTTLSTTITTVTTAATPATTETIPENPIYHVDDDPSLPYEFIKPKPGTLNSSYIDKFFIDDVFLTKKSGHDLIVCNYKYKNCWLSEPASFSDTYYDAMYIGGVQCGKFYPGFDSSEADESSKLLQMASAHVLVGYKIKDVNACKDKKFHIIIQTFNDVTKGFVVMEVEGNISDLKYKEVD